MRALATRQNGAQHKDSTPTVHSRADTPMSRAKFGIGVRGAAPVVREALESLGQTLDARTQALMGHRFGHDFSRVQVHSGSRAADSARALNARAYTIGQHVVFGAGQYQPATVAGQQLLAHELTHTLQQKAATFTLGRELGRSSPWSASEFEAKRTAAAVVQFGKTDRVPYAFQRETLTVNERHETAIQCQGVCESEAPASQFDVVEDYENQVCRPAEPQEVGATAPDTDPIDSEFWFVPTRVREGARPVLDDGGTNVVVGFRYSSGGYYEIYDLEGRFVEAGEPGLETPLFDPIDLLAGGLAGLGRGLIGGGARVAARGAVSRGAGAVLGGVGVRASVGILGRAALTAVRGAYRAIRFRGVLNFTATTAGRMADPARRVPHHILKLAIRFGRRAVDPQGAVGAFQYLIPMVRNGRQYTLEVVLREADQTVLHFLYR